MSLSRFYVYYYQLLIPLAQNNLHLLAVDGDRKERKVAYLAPRRRQSSLQIPSKLLEQLSIWQLITPKAAYTKTMQNYT